MDPSRRVASPRRTGARPIRPRTLTKGPLEADDPLSPQGSSTASPIHGSPRLSSTQLRSPDRSPSRPTGLRSPSNNNNRQDILSSLDNPLSRSSTPISSTSVPLTTKDFSFLLKPEIYHQISPLSIPSAFRTPSRQPSPETPILDLLARGHFRAAAIAAVQALTSAPVPATQAAAHPPCDPTDHARVFSLLYVRLSCLCLIDAVALAAQEAKALEDLNSAFYLDPVTGSHLVPWELRLLAVRLQTLGFGDPRRAVVSYFELARDARSEIAKASKVKDFSRVEVWKARLSELGIKVAGALIEQEDLLGAAEHLATLKDLGKGVNAGRLRMSKALLWLHVGDVEEARRCIRSGSGNGNGGQEDASISEKVLEALAEMADGEHERALTRWQSLKKEIDDGGVHDEMIGVNLAVCLLYVGRMEEGREILEELVADGRSSHTLLFNLSTMYELCTDRAKSLKLQLAERVAATATTSQSMSVQGWEKTNADFKL